MYSVHKKTFEAMRCNVQITRNRYSQYHKVKEKKHFHYPLLLNFTELLYLCKRYNYLIMNNLNTAKTL